MAYDQTTNDLKNKSEFLELNAQARVLIKGQTNFQADKLAVEKYLEAIVKPNLVNFSSNEERLKYLVENNYYEKQHLDKFTIKQLDELYALAYSYNHKFPSLMGAMKFFNTYGLKTFDGKKYLEDYEQRVVANAILLSDGDFELAKELVQLIVKGIYQPATPTFLNALKKQRGEYVSCYLLRMEDNMESISNIIGQALQLSKRGGGVSICLTNLRELGAPIKNIENNATGIIPVMKILEDTFSYANQLGQRQGAGSVYLNIHHPDILSFLDTKRENADEKIRIKSLSLGVVVPDITFELARDNKEMALFSPYDVQREYGVPFSDISVTKEYTNLVNNPRIKKTYVNARKLFQTIAELHFESGYPFIMFDDTVNNANPLKGRIIMSNLCSEILQVNTPSSFNADNSFNQVGEDVCCNLGSINIDKMVRDGKNFGKNIKNSIIALDYIAHNTDLNCSPSIRNGNRKNFALGLGAMNLHGFLATHKIAYNSLEAKDFTNMYFYTTAYYAYKTSNEIAREKNIKFASFETSKYADGSYFDKYTKCDEKKWTFQTETIKNLFDHYGIYLPTQQDWIKLRDDIIKYGLANSHLQAVAPTGSISYLSSCTPSLQPVVSPVEVRKDGKLGRIYVPAYGINEENTPYYLADAYELGAKPIIDIASIAQQHIDQAISLTLFYKETATTRDLNKAYIRAFAKKCASIYYVRVRQEILEGSENYTCESCTI